MVVLTLADIASLAKRRRTDDAAAFRTPRRADGPPHREVHPEQIAGNGGDRTTPTAGRFVAGGRFTARAADPCSFPPIP